MANALEAVKRLVFSQLCQPVLLVNTSYYLNFKQAALMKTVLEDVLFSKHGTFFLYFHCVWAVINYHSSLFIVLSFEKIVGFL